MVQADYMIVLDLCKRTVLVVQGADV